MANLRHYTVHRLRDFGSGDDDGISLTSFHTLEEAVASTPAPRASWRLLYKGSFTRSSSTDPIGETVSVPTWQSGSVDGWHYRISDDTEVVRLQRL